MSFTVATRAERRGIRRDAWFRVNGYQPEKVESHYTTWEVGPFKLVHHQCPPYVIGWKPGREPIYAKPADSWTFTFKVRKT